MRKRDALKYIPQRKELKQRERQSKTEAKRAEEEYTKVSNILAEIDGLEIFENFPIKSIDYGDSIEVLSGCDEVSRYANGVLKSSAAWEVRGYPSESDADEGGGKELGSFNSRTQALKAAKMWVAQGRTSSPKKNTKPVQSNK